jgi:hypothetical protein
MIRAGRLYPQMERVPSRGRMVEHRDSTSFLRGAGSVVAANKTWLTTLDNFMTDVNCLRSGCIKSEILDSVE